MENSVLQEHKISGTHDLLKGAEHICISTHTNPDGDALGSSTAMLSFLRSTLGKTDVNILLDTPVPDTLAFMSREGIICLQDDESSLNQALKRCDLLICLDYGQFRRAGENMMDRLGTLTCPKVLIDHHPNPDEQAFDIVFSCTEISSASELTYYILLAMPEIGGDAAKLPSECATALLTGMTTDTNNFANSTFPSTFKMASDLLAAGVDRDLVLSRLYNSYRENRVRAMGLLLKDRLTIMDCGAAYMVLDSATWHDLGLKEGETEGFVNIPLSIDKVKLCIFAKEDRDYCRISIRSKKGISANRLARESFNGGGHEQASGGRLYFNEDVKDIHEVAGYIEEVTARFMREDTPECLLK